MPMKFYEDDEYSDESKQDFEPGYVQWTSPDGINYLPASKTVPRLPPGIYEIQRNPQTGPFFVSVPVKTEGLLRFPETNSNKVVTEIKKFWEREEIFRKYQISYKRGILLYGPPGSGKSCTVQLVMADVVKRGGIVMKFEDPYTFTEGLRILRNIHADMPVVAVIEDIDDFIEHSKESHFLNILDGVESVDRVVFLATTNYPEKLGQRVMNRPSRFDKRFRIGFPSEKSRRMYFEHLIGKENIQSLNIDLDRWIKDTDKLSIAHLKELFVAVVILGDEYKSAIKTLKAMKEQIETKDFEESIGFSKVESDDGIYD